MGLHKERRVADVRYCLDKIGIAVLEYDFPDTFHEVLGNRMSFIDHHVADS
ncbi:MAG: hypothetical protein HN368_19855 [Spirochaetales bacterium]|nr:hypothetical protein [Spirochaetales bacterium]